MKLSVCIATFNRAGFIAQTLESIVPQLTAGVEIVVVDGGSSDHTPAVMAGLVRNCPAIAYHRERENQGVDRDFDKAVGYASGQYCWLLSDDDLLVPGAIAAVLSRLADEPDLLIVNAQIRTRELAGVLKSNQLELEADCDLNGAEQERLLALAGRYLSFIGAVVIRRAAWLARERAAYYGSQFIHVGVIFQAPPLARVRIVAQPLIQIRYGNASWSARGFDIWVRRWPGLIWSFAQYSDRARAGITARFPARSAKTLLWYRAIGAYGPAECRTLQAGREPYHPLAALLARVPARLANAGVAAYLYARRHADAAVLLYDLVRAGCASAAARWAAKRFRFPETER